MSKLSTGGSAAASDFRADLLISYETRLVQEGVWPQVYLILALSALHRRSFSRPFQYLYREGTVRIAMAVIRCQYLLSPCACCTFSRLCSEICVCVKCAVTLGFIFHLLIDHFGPLPAMCRVRFGLTGIYFDSLEPSRPREEFFQPLIASIPPVAQNKQGDAVPEATDGGEIKENVVTAMEAPKNDRDGIAKSLRDSLSRGESRPSSKKAKTNHASVGSKRVRNSVSPSSSVSSPPSSDEDHLVTSEFNLQVPKPISLRTTQKRSRKPSKRQTSTSPGGLTKAPPTKRVRFAMDLQESILPSDDAGGTSSSHSSDDSYTDPPSPTEPYDAFGGYYRSPGASRPHNMNGQITGWRTRIPAEVGTNIDGYDGFLQSEDGSEADVQALPNKRRPPKTVQAVAQGLTSDQRLHQNNSTPVTWPKYSGQVTDQLRTIASDLESNVDNGPNLKKSHASQKKSESWARSREQLRFSMLRSGKDLPEPIFVVRPRFLSDTKRKGKPAGRSSRNKYSRDISKNAQEGTRTSSPRTTRVNASKKSKTTNYRPPSVTDDLKRDVEFDEGLGILVRDV